MNTTTKNVVRFLMGSLFAVTFAFASSAGSSVTWFEEDAASVSAALSEAGKSGNGTWSSGGTLADVLKTADSTVYIDAEGSSVSYAPDNAVPASVTNVPVVIEGVCFSNSTDLSSIDMTNAKAGFAVVKVDGDLRFAYVDGGAWKTNESYTADATASYKVTVTFDYDAKKVTYAIENVGSIVGTLLAATHVTTAQFGGVGSFTKFSSAYEAEGVAKIVEIEATYETLEAAFKAAEAGQTIQLLDNIPSFAPAADDITAQKNVTLDLNGKTIASIDAGNANAKGYVISTNATSLAVKYPFASGDGSEASPWTIGDAASFRVFAQGVTARTYGTSPDQYFKQTADFALGEPAFAGVGVPCKDNYNKTDGSLESQTFMGVYDGDNHTISDVIQTKKEYGGLFNGVYKGALKNLKVTLGGNGGFLSSEEGTKFGGGAIVGLVREATLENLTTVRGTVTAFNTTHAVGGIVAFVARGAVVKNCTNNLDIVTTTTKGGGIACISQGEYGGAAPKFEGCVSNGKITYTFASNTADGGFGAIEGYMATSSVFEDCSVGPDFKIIQGGAGKTSEGTIIGIVKASCTATNAGGCTGPADKAALGVILATGVQSGFAYATVENDVATFVAGDTLTAGATYRAMLPGLTPSFAFTGAGTIAFDKTVYDDLDATVTAPNGYSVADSTAGKITTYTSSVVDYTIAYKTPEGGAFTAWKGGYTAPAKFAVTNVVTFPTAANVDIPAKYTFGGWTNAQGTAFAATSASYFENLTLIANMAEKAKGSAENPWVSGSTSVVTNNGVMTISGTGAMADYSSGDTPWKDVADEITEIDVEEGVVVGAGAFKDFTTQKIVFEDVTSEIKTAAFGGTVPPVWVIPEEGQPAIQPEGWKDASSETVYESIAEAKEDGVEAVVAVPEIKTPWLFNGKIGADWPNGSQMKGEWANAEYATLAGEDNHINVSTPDDGTLDFNANTPAPFTNGAVLVNSQVKFTPVADASELPEVPADVKAGLTLVTDEQAGTNYFYGVTATGWAKIDALAAGDYDTTYDVVVEMSGTKDAPKVAYGLVTDGGATTNMSAQFDAKMPAAAEAEVAGVSYAGEGEVASLVAYAAQRDYAVIVDGKNFDSFDEGYLAATNGSSMKLLKNATWSAVPAAGIALKAINLDLNGKTLTVADAVKNAVAAKGYKLDGATVKLPFASGDGTEANPYTIGDYETLDLFRQGVNAGSYGVSGEYFQQTANISFEGKPTWAGITLFKANYDGNGKAITGLVLDGGNTYRGFFTETMNATVKNLTVEMGAGGAFLDPAGNTIAEKSGFDLGDYDNTDPTAFGGAAMVGKANTGSTFIGCTTKGDIAGTHNAGGFVTRFYGNCHFIDCTNEVNTIGTYTKVGGFAVIVQNAGSEIVRCVNKGNVRTYGDEGLTDSTKSPGCDGVGGILAYNSATVTIKDCVNEGTVSSDAAEIKGSDKTTEPAQLPRVGALVGFSSGSKATLLGTNTVADSMLAIGASGTKDHYADFALATVEGGVATLPATVEVGGEYKVMAPVASVTFEFTEAGSLSFNTNLCLTFTADIAATEDYTVKTSGEPPVVVYTAELSRAMEYDGIFVTADEATAIIETAIRDGETKMFTFYAKVNAKGCTFVAGSVLEIVDGKIWCVTSAPEVTDLVAISNVAVQTQIEVDTPAALSGSIDVSKTPTAPDTILWLTEDAWLSGDVVVGHQVAEAVKLFLGAEAQAPIAQLVLDGTLTPGDFKLKLTRYGEVWSLNEIDDAVVAYDDVGNEIRKEFDTYTGYWIYTAVVKGAKNAISGETVIDADNEDAALKIAADSVVESEDEAANAWLDAHGKTIDYRALWTIEVSAGGAAGKWKLTPTLLAEVKEALQAAVDAASAQIADVKENRMVIVETLPGVRYGVVSAASVEELATKTEPEAWTIGTGDNVNLAVEVFEGKTFFKVVAKP